MSLCLLLLLIIIIIIVISITMTILIVIIRLILIRIIRWLRDEWLRAILDIFASEVRMLSRNMLVWS